MTDKVRTFFYPPADAKKRRYDPRTLKPFAPLAGASDAGQMVESHAYYLESIANSSRRIAKTESALSIRQITKHHHSSSHE